MSKRLKRVFNTSDQVIHLWANQSQSDARCTNVFFDRETVYSYGYHYVLGRLVEYNGATVALINDRGYSVTTAKHINQALYATAHLITLRVEGLSISDEPKAKINEALERSERELCEEITAFFAKKTLYSWACGSWSEYISDTKYSLPARIINHNATCKALNELSYTIKLTPEFIQDFDAHIAWAKQNQSERDARQNSPECIADR